MNALHFRDVHADSSADKGRNWAESVGYPQLSVRLSVSFGSLIRSLRWSTVFLVQFTCSLWFPFCWTKQRRLWIATLLYRSRCLTLKCVIPFRQDNQFETTNLRITKLRIIKKRIYIDRIYLFDSTVCWTRFNYPRTTSGYLEIAALLYGRMLIQYWSLKLFFCDARDVRLIVRSLPKSKSSRCTNLISCNGFNSII